MMVGNSLSELKRYSRKNFDSESGGIRPRSFTRSGDGCGGKGAGARTGSAGAIGVANGACEPFRLKLAPWDVGSSVRECSERAEEIANGKAGRTIKAAERKTSAQTITRTISENRRIGVRLERSASR